MKIIKEGTLPSKKPWWAQEVRFRCKCGCIFTLDESDTVTVEESSQSIVYPCPTCRKDLLLCKTSITKQKAVFEEIFGEGGMFEKVFGKQ